MTVKDPRAALTTSQQELYDQALDEATQNGADLVEVLLGTAYAQAAAEDMRAVHVAFGGSRAQT